MKRILAVFITLLMILIIITACSNDTPDTSSEYVKGLESDPIESYDNVSFFVPEDDASTAVSEESSEADVSDTTSEESSKPDVSDTTSVESNEPDVSDTTSVESNEPDVSDTTSVESNEPDISDTTSIESSNDENSSTSDESQGEKPNVGGFLVMDKKYTYKDKNVVIVNVENQTDKNYTVTINGKYLDKNGNVLKTKTQTSNQYSANYQGYFLFDPDISFDKFAYTFEIKQSSGPFYAKDIVYVFKGLSEWKVPNGDLLAQGDFTQYPHICAAVNMAYKGTAQLFIKSTWVFINDKGQIVGFGDINEPILSDPNPKFEGESHLQLYYTKEDKLVWPDEFKGEITAILIVRDVQLSDQKR